MRFYNSHVIQSANVGKPTHDSTPSTKTGGVSTGKFTPVVGGLGVDLKFSSKRLTLGSGLLALLLLELFLPGKSYR